MKLFESKVKDLLEIVRLNSFFYFGNITKLIFQKQYLEEENAILRDENKNLLKLGELTNSSIKESIQNNSLYVNFISFLAFNLSQTNFRMAKKIIHLNLKNNELERAISVNSDTTDNPSIKNTQLERENSGETEIRNNITSIQITTSKLPEEPKPEVVAEKIIDIKVYKILLIA